MIRRLLLALLLCVILLALSCRAIGLHATGKTTESGLEIEVDLEEGEVSEEVLERPPAELAPQ